MDLFMASCLLFILTRSSISHILFLNRMSAEKIVRPKFTGGITAAEMGKILMNISQNGDGVDLEEQFDKAEEDHIRLHYGENIGDALAEILSNALEVDGKNPDGFDHVYAYADGIFYTFSFGTFAKQAQSV